MMKATSNGTALITVKGEGCRKRAKIQWKADKRRILRREGGVWGEYVVVTFVSSSVGTNFDYVHLPEIVVAAYHHSTT